MAHHEWHSQETVSEDTNEQHVVENHPNCTLNQSSSSHYIPFTGPSNIPQDRLLIAPGALPSASQLSLILAVLNHRLGSFSDSLEQNAHPATVYEEIWPLFTPDPGQAAYIFDSTHLGAGYTPIQSSTSPLSNLHRSKSRNSTILMTSRGTLQTLRVPSGLPRRPRRNRRTPRRVLPRATIAAIHGIFIC
jgi:hypothetical protein